MPAIRQDSFAGGLLSEQFLGKASQQKYATGLRTCENFWITRQGNAENRPGTQYVASTRDSSVLSRLVKFVLNADDSALLEFSTSHMIPRVAGARVSTVGAPAYAGGTAYIVGNVVTYLGATYVCILPSTGNLPSNVTYWYAQAGNLLDLVSNLQQTWLPDMQAAQQNDVMVLTAQSFYPQEINRFSSQQWTFAAFAPRATIPDQGIWTITPGTFYAIAGAQLSAGAGTVYTTIGIGELYALGGDTSLTPDTYTIVGVTGGARNDGYAFPAVAQGKASGAWPVTLNWNADATAIGGFYIYRLFAGKFKRIANVAAGVTTFVDTGTGVTVDDFSPVFPQNYYAYVFTKLDPTTGEESLPSLVAGCISDPLSSTVINRIYWDAIDGIQTYRVYRMLNGIFGFVGEANSDTGRIFATGYAATTKPSIIFLDNGIIPDLAIQPPVMLDPFNSLGNPAAVGLYQQRWFFGGFTSALSTFVASRVGIRQNFNVSTPITEEGPIEATIASARSDVVRHFVDLGRLIIHTSGAEYVANGNQAGSMTPLAIGLVQQGSAGASLIPPLAFGNSGFFVQSRGGFLRDLRYEIQSTSYAGKDTTIYAPDLFASRTIVSMDWQQIPHSIIWAALDDGTLLGLTYIREQDVWAWHTHTISGGSVEQVCVVPESTEDVVYLVVKRTINGTTTRYIERVASRDFDTIDDAVFCDSSLSYDGRNTGARTMHVTTGATWTPQDSLTITASTPYFAAGDVGNAIVLQQVTTAVTYDDDGVRIPIGTITDQVTLDIIAYTSTTVVTAQADKDVPTWARVALTTWGKAVHHFTGLNHLEGETVTGLGDGDVMPDMVVASGAVTTENNILRATIGLPITANLQTLPLENTQGETIANKKVLVTELTATLYQTRGILSGEDFDNLFPWVQRQSEPWSDPVSLFTGNVRIGVQGSWQKTGQLCIRQNDPLPVGISALAVSAFVGN